MKKVSILVPCYNEEASLPLLYAELVKLMDGRKDYAWEVLLVNDGSKDRTLEIMRELRTSDARISYSHATLERRMQCLPDSIM